MDSMPMPKLSALFEQAPDVRPSIEALRDMCNRMLENPDNFDEAIGDAQNFINTFEEVSIAVLFFTQGLMIAKDPMIRLAAALEVARKS